MFSLINVCIGLLLTNNYNRRANVNMLEPYDLIKMSRNTPIHQYSYNELIQNIKNIDTVAIVENKNVAIVHDKFDNINLYKYFSQNVDYLINVFINNKIDFQLFDLSNQGNFNIPLPLQFFIGLVLFNIINYISFKNNMNSPMNFMNRNKEIDMNIGVNTTFNDVAGIPEAKEELYEIVDFLKNPVKYAAAGAKIPRGVLLEGEPGTGKTLLARAVAGEANVNFISASGSEFVEMFVGVGAQRVRSLFNKAKENSPCVIFIDEIDAIGGKRGSGFNSGGNDEREQTLNQILTNMDGFEKTDGIIVLAATNRIDTLDSALLRSGRFDRKVKVTLPTLEERKEIAKIHFKNKNANFSYDTLAQLTSGFSGADLENLANEAAILSIRNNETIINNDLILQSFEKTTIGLPKKNDPRSLEVKKLIALHEAGHAIIVNSYTEYFNLQKVTINANTVGAGGYTLFTPKDFYNEYPTKGFYMARIMATLGGRAAEILHSDIKMKGTVEIEQSHVTTGASNDLMQATKIASSYYDLFESYVIDDTYSDNFKYNKEKRIKEIIDKCLEQTLGILKFYHTDLLLLRNRLLANNTVSF